MKTTHIYSTKPRAKSFLWISEKYTPHLVCCILIVRFKIVVREKSCEGKIVARPRTRKSFAELMDKL